MLRCSFLMVVLSLMVSSFGFAQPGNIPDANFQITGIVLDSVSGKPVEYATVALVSMRDSSIAGGGITNAMGEFSFVSKTPGRFMLRINFMGYANKSVGPVQLKPGSGPLFDLGKILIAPSAQSLSGVDIVAEKPMIELSIDKKVVNVAQNLNTSGGTALDVLKEVPSVEVDEDGNVSLRGSENVTILIDGRPSTMTGADRRAAMEQIPASSIESVELITNPSAKYSPEGMTGIINIILKKKKGTGLNTLLSLNAGTKDKYSASFSASYSTDKWTLFGNYNYQNRKRTVTGESERITYDLIESYFLRQDIDEIHGNQSHNIKFGGEYHFTPRFIVAASASTFIFSDREDQKTMNYTMNPENIYTQIYSNNSLENASMNNWDANLNIKKRFTKPKHEIILDFSMSEGNRKDSSFNRITFLEEDFATVTSEIPEWSKTVAPNLNSVKTLKLDYVYPFNDSTKLEAGFDGSRRSIDADSRYYNYDFGGSGWVFNDTTSNHFLFNENIAALYANYSTKIKKWGLSIGSRIESASTNAREADSLDNRKTYYSLFPTGALSYKISKVQEIQLTYSRRINRPSFRDLNPYRDYSAWPNIRTGNPFLDPEYVNALEMSYAWYSKRGTFMPTVFYRRITDVISRYRMNLNDSVYLMMPENYTSATSYGFEMIYTHKPLKWWNTTISGSWYRHIVDGSNVETSITAAAFGWQLRNSNSFRFAKGWEGSFSVFYRSPRETGQGIRDAMFMADCAIKKSFLNDKLAISLNVRDLFNTMKFRMNFMEADYEMYMQRKMEGRVFMLGFTWKLSGDYKSKEKRSNANGNGANDVDDGGF
ncbi:MAG: TonB-dependent receptor [Bacteroidales bacterium]